MATNTAQMQSQSRNLSIDYLRGLLMLLVVFHHATLGYGTSGVGVLISDPAQFLGFDLIALYNDSFFMFAFFFISGLFTYKAIVKKGSKIFLIDRFIRLIFPFAFGALFINPIAHYFAEISVQETPASISGFFRYFIHTFGQIEANHLWFLWVLFSFSLLLSAIRFISNNKSDPLFFNNYGIKEKSGLFILFLIVIGLILYLPFRNISDGGFVLLFPPFDMQLSRAPLYFLFFVSGSLIGTYGLQKSFFSKETFQNKWPLFISLSLLSTILSLVLHVIRLLTDPGLAYQLVFIIEQGLLVFISIFGLLGFMGLFNKHVHSNHRFMDILSSEAMGIYVIHYSIVTSLQYAFSFFVLPGVVKGLLVTALGLLVSLLIVLLLKKIPYLNILFGAKYAKSQTLPIFILTFAALAILIFR